MWLVLVMLWILFAQDWFDWWNLSNLIFLFSFQKIQRHIPLQVVVTLQFLSKGCKNACSYAEKIDRKNWSSLVQAIFSYEFIYHNIVCSLSEVVSVPEYKFRGVLAWLGSIAVACQCHLKDTGTTATSVWHIKSYIMDEN